MTAGMAESSDNDALAADEVCDVVRKSGNVDAPIAADALTPEERLANDSCTNTLDLRSEPRAQTRSAPLIESDRLLSIALGLREEFENCAHRPGAISRNRAKTSDAGTVWDSPASKRAIR
jgi:hypothetical protein